MRPTRDEVGARRRAWLVDARLYFICDARPGGRDPEEILRPALQGGVDIVQLREKSGDGRAIVRAGRVFRRLCDAYDALFIVNDRPDLAIACAADGVHLGQDDGAAAAARQIVGDDLLIGTSTHSARAGRCRYRVRLHRGRSRPRDADEAGLRTGRDRPRGYAARHARSPFFAIGGIDPDNAAEVVLAGAERIAVVRRDPRRTRPRRAARSLRARVEAGRGVGAR